VEGTEADEDFACSTNGLARGGGGRGVFDAGSGGYSGIRVGAGVGNWFAVMVRVGWYGRRLGGVIEYYSGNVVVQEDVEVGSAGNRIVVTTSNIRSCLILRMYVRGYQGCSDLVACFWVVVVS
jgi:hypothetical protein